MQEIIERNKNLIYSIARYFENYSNKEDLFQAGCIGMILAYKNYDKTKNVKFTTYAYHYILGEMKKLIMEDKGIKISRNLQLLYLKIEKARCLLSQKLMRQPSLDEISDYLNIEKELVIEAINSQDIIYSIDQPLNEEGRDITLQEVISTKRSDVDTLLMLKEELSKLSPFEKQLINNRYINDFTQQQTAENLGISQVNVSRSEQKVLAKLKNKLLV